ncbi:MAG: ATP-binding cassette domain-containing protein [Ruminococcaceae bacterium]|nr:ATP-binding cassette domain-containing protein [Oscillospiraceae bacterium]
MSENVKTPLIEAQNLKLYFPTAKGMVHAVDDLNFPIPEGATLGVVGESGCGKSTLGRTLLNILKPTGGKVLFDGEDVTKFNRKQMQQFRQNAQMIFQDPYSSIDPRLTVAESIAEAMIVNKICPNRAEREKQVQKLMDTVGLASRLYNAYPHELDGGRLQRVGIARALSVNPRFIVCDEPVSALDVSIQAQILNLLMDLQDEMKLTYMFITHDLSVVKHISDDIMVMYMGHCIERGPKKELFANPQHPYTKALLSAVPVPNLSMRNKKPTLLQGEVTSPIDPPEGCRFAARCPYATEKCREKTPQLKELSPNHVVACTLFD